MLFCWFHVAKNHHLNPQNHTRTGWCWFSVKHHLAPSWAPVGRQCPWGDQTHRSLRCKREVKKKGRLPVDFLGIPFGCFLFFFCVLDFLGVVWLFDCYCFFWLLSVSVLICLKLLVIIGVIFGCFVVSSLVVGLLRFAILAYCYCLYTDYFNDLFLVCFLIVPFLS